MNVFVVTYNTNKEDAKADREKIIKQIGSRLADTEISEHPVT